jgi:DNA primase
VIVQTLSTAQRQYFEQAVSQYQRDLAADTSARGYLMGRGIGPQAAATYRLGVVRTPLPGHEQYAGRLLIPYLTPAGPVNLRFRCLKAHVCADSGCPKYLSMDGVSGNLYNVLDLHKDSPFICVAEGELDALTLSMCDLPAVGVPGVKTWQKHFSRCLEDFDVIYAFGDGDDAGGKFSSFLAKEARARPISMPKGMDVNALYLQGGSEALRALIQS